MITFSEFEQILEEETYLLPDQSPLEHFVHHNNLHHFENGPFEKTVEEIYQKYGKTAYMPLSYFRKKISEGEISRAKMAKRLLDILETKLPPDIINYIIDDLFTFSDQDQLKFQRKENLFYNKDFSKLITIKENDLKIWDRMGHFSKKFKGIRVADFHVNNSLGRLNKILIPFLSTMVDQGQANVTIKPELKDDPWKIFIQYLESILSHEQINELKQISFSTTNLREFVFQKYFQQANNENELRHGLRIHLQSIPGWAGMILKMEKNREVTPRRFSTLTLDYYLLFRCSLEEVFKKKQFNQEVVTYSDYLVREHVFHFLINNGQTNYSEEHLYEIFIQLNPIILARVFQQAYEETYGDHILSGLKNKKYKTKNKPKYQMFFCIDDREESMRRYLEEESNEIETFGVAGFFGLDMMFQGEDELFPRRMCPPVAKPNYLIKENSDSKLSKRQGAITRLMYDGQVNFFQSLFKNFFIAIFKALTFKFHLYFPKERGKIVKKFLAKKHQAKIDFSRDEKIESGKFFYGYTIDESAARVAAILKGAGLVKDFSTYLIFLGHGHDSFNNPHVAAYRCGACSGANGIPNAKIYASLGNLPEVRQVLKNTHQIDIPTSTFFISGYHDTCNDYIELYNLNEISMPKEDEKELKKILLKARQLNAKERAQKFYQSNKKLAQSKYLGLVEGRAWNIAEPRPELNHATNALCIVGRRDLTRNIFLDRKSFLVSYDAGIDSTGAILEGLLRAVMPVCSGINLEYYFSKVDTENYGSGSKTSHNVFGLTGVMNGVRGDLRTGLVWQMVEYHDPLRILFIVETKEEAINKILAENLGLKDLVYNKWILLSIVDPDNHQHIKKFENGRFVEFKDQEIQFPSFLNSSKVKSTILKPCHFAYLGES